jgi:hypothetical protein
MHYRPALTTLSLGLVSLTLIRAMQEWRAVNGPLYNILVKHNIFYYACGLRESRHTFISVHISDDSCHESSCDRERPYANAIFTSA